MKFFLILLFFITMSFPATAGRKLDEKQKANFEDSWRFYKWRIEQGDPLTELESILVRIYNKYSNTSINIVPVLRELEAVRALNAVDSAKFSVTETTSTPKGASE